MMSPANALKQEAETAAYGSHPSKIKQETFPARLPSVKAGSDRTVHALKPVPEKAAAQKQNSFHFQPRVPVITGEATYRGYLPIDGIVSGQLHATGGALTIKQRPRNGRDESSPELDGEISFKDMLRVNGHVGGKLLSPKGTLIVDAAATVDALIDVAVAVINGAVNGDVIARERVELGPSAVVHGNISTPALSMKPGATFQGDCCMLNRAE
jgi:cytoskeletal protein CcmA (bactofilin family)